jgi:hypothetical protein
VLDDLVSTRALAMFILGFATGAGVVTLVMRPLRRRVEEQLKESRELAESAKSWRVNK